MYSTNKSYIMKSNAVKGLTTMSHKQQLHNFAQELVSNYAQYDGDNYILSLYDIPEDEQNEFARLYIESTDRDLSECVYGGDFSLDNDYTCALLALLADNCVENRERFAEVTRKNTIKYYANTLDGILDIECDYFLHAINNERGYQAQYDLDHGDIVWR